ncbi:hypothetical protein CFU_2223 [Collimonas fungivorans Ter331]|uniref:Uncharacterized protein n=1 Tax=Collimonas fungivorans (strain Ter331) TaxID=1005048 RepID=G0AKC3_COLFT|nr:hypothetical protein CFU_2223 [Collimonas fungivorans Ter331]
MAFCWISLWVTGCAAQKALEGLKLPGLVLAAVGIFAGLEAAADDVVDLRPRHLQAALGVRIDDIGQEQSFLGVALVVGTAQHGHDAGAGLHQDHFLGIRGRHRNRHRAVSGAPGLALALAKTGFTCAVGRQYLAHRGLAGGAHFDIFQQWRQHSVFRLRSSAGRPFLRPLHHIEQVDVVAGAQQAGKGIDLVDRNRDGAAAGVDRLGKRHRFVQQEIRFQQRRALAHWTDDLLADIGIDLVRRDDVEIHVFLGHRARSQLLHGQHVARVEVDARHRHRGAHLAGFVAQAFFDFTGTGFQVIVGEENGERGNQDNDDQRQRLLDFLQVDETFYIHDVRVKVIVVANWRESLLVLKNREYCGSGGTCATA